MPVKQPDLKKLEEIANRTRINVVKMIAYSGVGHLGGAVSIAEILAVLYFYEMNYDPKDPDWEDRDRFVLSKGHGCPALYATLAEAGCIPKDLLPTLHQIDSPLQMHPERGLCPGIEMSTGALGQGLSAGVGMAYGARLRKKDFRVYVVIGCGESHEGQIWEAAMSAAKFKLDNLVAMIDYNKFALCDRTQSVMPLEPLYDKWVAFGWHVIEVNGHSVAQLINALDEARQIKGKPTFIVAHTVKGRGVSFIEDTAPSHSVSMTNEQVTSTLKELGCPQKEIEATLAQIKETH
ncbi:MAG: transketolase [Planctomycetota bacterium]|jgi:transketolase